MQLWSLDLDPESIFQKESNAAVILPFLDLLSLLRGSVHQLKFVEVNPGIPKVWIQFHSSG